jgi:hypothetical protein
MGKMACPAMKKGLTANRRKSFRIKVPKTGLEPARPLQALGPEQERILFTTPYGTIYSVTSIELTLFVALCQSPKIRLIWFDSVDICWAQTALGFGPSGLPKPGQHLMPKPNASKVLGASP